MMSLYFCVGWGKMRVKQEEVVLWTGLGGAAHGLFFLSPIWVSNNCMSFHLSSIKTAAVFVGVELWVALGDPLLKEDSINVGRSTSVL